MKVQDGFFIAKETFANLSVSTQQEVLAALGLNILQDKDDLMELSPKDMSSIVEALTVDCDDNSIQLLQQLGLFAKPVLNIKAFAKRMQMSDNDLFESLVRLNNVVTRNTERQLLEVTTLNDNIYVSKTTIDSIRKTFNMKPSILRRFHRSGRNK